MGVAYNSRIVTDGLVLALDAGNRKSYSHNYHPKPIDIYSWVTSGYQQTLSRDTIQSPVGNTPLKIVTSGTSSYTNSYNSPTWNIASAAQGQTWTVSFYVKANVSTTISMLIFEANSSGNYTTYTQPFFNIGTDWTRVSGTSTFTQATTAFIQARIDCYVSGVTLWVDGFQVERSSSMSTFTSVYTGETSFNLINSTNNGSLTNGVSYSDVNNGSFVFDGVDDYVSVTSLSNYNFGSSLSVFVWNYNVGGDYRGLINNGYFDGCGFELRYGRENYFGGSNNGTSLYVKLNTSSGTNSVTINSELNVWGYYGFVYNGSQLIAYKNGSQFASVSLTGNVTVRSNPVIIGWDSLLSQYLSGRVSNCSIYNRALSAAEIQQNFNANRSRFGI